MAQKPDSILGQFLGIAQKTDGILGQFFGIPTMADAGQRGRGRGGNRGRGRAGRRGRPAGRGNPLGGVGAPTREGHRPQSGRGRPRRPPSPSGVSEELESMRDSLARLSFSHSDDCAGAVAHLRAILGVTGDLAVASLPVILDTAAPSVKSVIGRDRRAIKAFVEQHACYFNHKEMTRTISLVEPEVTWPSEKVEQAAILHLRQRLASQGGLSLQRVMDHFTQAPDKVRQFLSSGGKDGKTKLISLIIKYSSDFVVCGEDVKLTPGAADSLTDTPQDGNKEQTKETKPKARKSQSSDRQTQSEPDFAHTDMCFKGVRFLVNLIRYEGPQASKNLANKIRRSAVAGAFPVNKGFVNLKGFVEGHPHYLEYDTSSNTVSVKKDEFTWNEGHVTDEAVKYLKTKLAKPGKVVYMNFGSYFGQAPDKVKSLLAKKADCNQNEKVACLVRKRLDDFVICGDELKMVSSDEEPASANKEENKSTTGAPTFSGMSGNIGKLTDVNGFINCSMAGTTESVYFDKRSFVETVSNPKLSLKDVLTCGERVFFDATLGRPGAASKFKATRVWKADYQRQASDNAESTKSKGPRGNKSKAVEAEDSSYSDILAPLSIRGAGESTLSRATEAEESYEEGYDEDEDYDYDEEEEDEDDMYGSGEEEEMSMGSEVGSALVRATSGVISQFRRNSATSVADLQAGIATCVQHLNAVSAVLKSVDPQRK